MPKRSLTISFLLLCLLCGCQSLSSPSAAQPPSGVDFARWTAHWTLDRQMSDDVPARLMPLFDRNEQRWRRNIERFDEQIPRESDGRGSVNDEGASSIGWLRRERQKEAQNLIAFATPATQLEIQASAREMRIGSNKGEGTRVFVPGESTALFMTVGGFNVTAGWKDGWFIIDSRGEGETKTHMIEQYRLAADGAQLEERLEVRFAEIRKQEFHIVYRRT